MAGPRSPFPLRYLDEAVGFLVPRSLVSFPVSRPTFRSFVPLFFVPCSQIYHNIMKKKVNLRYVIGMQNVYVNGEDPLR